MLVVGSNSTCDICLESYTTGANVPHSITCGHVFCQKCLNHLIQHKCPLCRERFSPREIRKLHVECDPTTVESRPSEVAPKVDNEAQRLLDDIARIVKEGAKINEIRKVIDDCRTYYKSQPGNQYTPVRVGALLLHSLMEGQRKLGLQAEELREIAAARDEIRDRLTTELQVAESKYQDLERTSRDEKDTALAVEKSLREHYDQMNSFWKSQLESAQKECRVMREEIGRVLTLGAALTLRNVELQHAAHRPASEQKRACGNDEGGLTRLDTKGKFVDNDYDFHLSPLAEVEAPLASTAPSLRALTDDFDDDVVKVKRARSPIKEVPEPDSETEDYSNAASTAYPAHLQPQSEPIPVPSRTPPSRQSSAMAIITADQWPSGISASKPREEQLVSKLYDILDSPRPSSTLHGHMQQRSEFPEPAFPRASSRVVAPSRPSSTHQLASSSASVAYYPESDPYAALPADRKPLVRASDVALQLEKERLERLEKERRRVHETSAPAPALAPSALTNSLKDATNTPVDAHYLNRHRSTSGKTKATYPVPADTYA